MKDLDAIRHLGVPKKLLKGTLLFAPGDKAAGFFSVESGELRVFRMDEAGKEVEIVRVGQGGLLGEAIAFAATSFPFYAEAVTDTEILYFSKKNVLDRLNKEPALGKYFLHLLARKCLTLNQRIETLGLMSVRSRLIQYLFAHCYGERNCRIELKTKKSELAKKLGTISETLSRTFKQLQDEGLIRVEGKYISILNCAGLREELPCDRP